LRNAAFGPDLCYMARLEQERGEYTHGVRSVSNDIVKEPTTNPGTLINTSMPGLVLGSYYTFLVRQEVWDH